MVNFLDIRYIKAMYGLGKKCLIVGGLPGGGKTRRVIHSVVDMSERTKVIYASPLRSLRNWVASYVKGLGYEVNLIRSKFETCQRVRAFIRTEDIDSIIDYLYIIAKVCSQCKVKDQCEFIIELKDFIHSRNGFWCTTHHLLYILTFMIPNMFKDTIIIIDEADQYLDLFKYAMNEKELQDMLNKARKDKLLKNIINRLLKSTHKFGMLYFFKPNIPRSRLLIFISATLTFTHLDFIHVPQIYSIFFEYVPSEIHDKCVKYPRILTMNKVDKPLYESMDKVIESLSNVIIKLYDNGLSVGVACRNYIVNRQLCSIFAERGIKFYSDVLHDDPPPRGIDRPFIILWTTRGKWFRGLSLPDTDVIICTYQSPIEIDPKLINYLAIDIEYEYEITRVINDSTNVQSYFRTNRIRSKTHHIVFLDLRSYNAMLEIFKQQAIHDALFKRWYYNELTKNVKTIDSVTEITQLF